MFNAMQLLVYVTDESQREKKVCPECFALRKHVAHNVLGLISTIRIGWSIFCLCIDFFYFFPCLNTKRSKKINKQRILLPKITGEIKIS